MVDVVGALLSAFLQVLFDRIASRQFVEYFSGNNLDQTLLQSLKILLLSVNVVLGDAEEKQIVDPNVKSWVDELRDAVYDAEDVLDQIATQALQRSVDYESQPFINGARQVGDYLSSLNPFSERINSKLEGINERLSSIVEYKDILGLKEGGAGKTSFLCLPTTCLINEFDVFGRHGDKDKIIDFLLSLNRKKEGFVSVIAIVGMAGMGKTTLSQIVYNDSRVKRHFKVTSWIYVSEGSNVFEVTKKIYDSLTYSNSNIADLNTLQMKLKLELSGKKFLLVLDDYWTENFLDWDLLKRPLEVGLPGSSIIVTTRNQSVALTMHAAETYLLQRLSDEDCWDLFAHHAFRTRAPEASPTLKEIGEKIVRKCKGHPLAVKTYGSLLAFKGETEDWNNMLQKKVWDLPASKSSLLPALRLSYHHLPGHIKGCFTYCSIFPKGYKINKLDLIRLWMAEGLLPASRNEETVEEAGEEYLHQLVSRSFLQQSTSDESSVIIHDLMSELAQHAGGEFFHTFEHNDPQQVPEKIRHMSFLSDKLDKPKDFGAFYDLSKQLRTFLPLKLQNNSGLSTSMPEALLGFLLDKLVCLRALSLSHYPISILSSSIGNIKHLRYLNLSHTFLVELPDSVGSLYNLQTLLLSGCQKLTRLPTTTKNLISLLHLDISGTNLSKMPPQFGRLEHLQRLTTFVVNKASSMIGELEALSRLQGALSIVSLQNVVNGTDASKANLKGKKFLDDLELIWADGIANLEKQEIVLHNLQPHRHLKRLKIENYGGRMFPDWLGSSSFSNMVSVSLVCCRNCLSLPPLGQLPNLRILHIKNMTALSRVGPEFFGNHTRPFSSLEILTFEDMLNWELWQLDEGREFPSLQVFRMIRCPRLGGSLPRLPSLRELELTGCNALATLPAEMMQGNGCLSKLVICNCPSLESIPEEQISLTLKSVEIFECSKLNLFLAEHAPMRYNALEDFHIASSCDNLISFPLSLFPKLRNLHIRDCCSLESVSLLPQLHQDLLNLRNIEINGCPELRSFPDGGLPTPNLKWLSISYCYSILRRVEWGLHAMASLVSFTFKGRSNAVQNFPEEGLLPACLTSLQISNLPNLSSLSQTAFQYLASLKSMKIIDCNMLEFQPDLGFPNSLTSLTISRCSLLAPQCQRDAGPRWNVVARLQYLEIDGVKIIS